MRRAIELFFIAVISLFVFVPIVSSQPAQTEAERILVGRAYHVEGEVLRYVPESDDWIAVVADAPFGLDDALYSGEEGRAEFIMPNQTRIRIGGTTQIQLITLGDQLTRVDVASGVARFYNNSSEGLIKATTPFGYVVAEAGTAFDLYVGDQAVEVVSLRGTVEYVLEKDETKYEVSAMSPSIISDESRVTAGEGTVDADWHAWNEERDNLWAKRLQVRGESVRYLPEGLHDESYVLDEHGRWDRVMYEGRHHNLWRPSNVAPGWEPFTAGRWAVYHGDNAWIPDEPFGYVTHHYGSWVYVPRPGGWYWAPPVVHAPPVRPALNIAFSWYPGRVLWIHSGVHLGWVPLAPFEPYYAHRFWGPRTVVVRDVRRVNIRVNRFRHVNRAVIINKSNLFAVNDYRNVRIRDISRATIVRDYRPAPFITDRVVSDFSRIRERHNFRNIDVARLPHRTVHDRIERNRRAAIGAANIRERQIQRDLRGIRRGSVARDVRIERPRVSDRLVSREEARRARTDVRFRERELKRQDRRLERALERQERRGRIREQRRRAVPAQQLREQRQQRLQQERQRRQQLQQQQRQRQQRLQQERQRRQQQQRLQRQRQQQQRQRQQRLQQERQRRQQLQQQQRQRQQRLQQERQRRQQQQRLQRQRQQQQQRQRQQRLQQERQRRQQQQRLQRQRQQQQRLQERPARQQRLQRRQEQLLP